MSARLTSLLVLVSAMVGVSTACETESGSQDLMTMLKHRNEDWAASVLRTTPNFFQDHFDNGQKPDFLWIGCSDSRTTETTIFDQRPGTFFALRNVANQLLPSDAAMQATMEHGVGKLKVKHIIVGGHTDCGGVQTALLPASKSKVSEWVEPIRKIAAQFKGELDRLPNQRDKELFLAKKNVEAGVKFLQEYDLVRSALEKGEVQVHGGIYDVGSGNFTVFQTVTKP